MCVYVCMCVCVYICDVLYKKIYCKKSKISEREREKNGNTAKIIKYKCKMYSCECI